MIVNRAQAVAWGCLMMSRMQPWHEIATFFLSVCVVLVLLLLVVVPAHSQAQMAPHQSAVELVQDPVTTPSTAMLVCLVLQFLFLAGMMLSYLRISRQIESRERFPHHHWWQHLHWPH
jgi:hypothetical protein